MRCVAGRTRAPRHVPRSRQPSPRCAPPTRGSATIRWTSQWWGGQFASGRLPDDSDLLDRVAGAHAAVSVRCRPRGPRPYGSDLRLLTGLGGIPTLQYGPGDSAAAHGPDESVPLAEMHTTARALAVLALDICGVDSVR